MHGLSRINSSRQVSHFVQGWSKIQHVSVCLPVASKAGTHPILGFNQGLVNGVAGDSFSHARGLRQGTLASFWRSTFLMLCSGWQRKQGFSPLL
jgi:hypothetical protein